MATPDLPTNPEALAVFEVNMSKANEAAFPYQQLGGDGLPMSEPTPGLSKREYFAAMAMQGMMATNVVRGEHPDKNRLFTFEEARADIAVRHADALLAELAKESP